MFQYVFHRVDHCASHWVSCAHHSTWVATCFTVRQPLGLTSRALHILNLWSPTSTCHVQLWGAMRMNVWASNGPPHSTPRQQDVLFLPNHVVLCDPTVGSAGIPVLGPETRGCLSRTKLCGAMRTGQQRTSAPDPEATRYPFSPKSRGAMQSNSRVRNGFWYSAPRQEDTHLLPNPVTLCGPTVGPATDSTPSHNLGPRPTLLGEGRVRVGARVRARVGVGLGLELGLGLGRG